MSWPDYTSVGLENSTGTVGQLYSYANSANLVAGRAVQFTPGTGTAVNWGCDHVLTITVSDDTDPVNVGDTITYKIHWNAIGFGGVTQAALTAAIPGNTTFVAASGGITPVGLADFNATQAESTTPSLVAVIAVAMLALCAGFAWQRRTN